MLSSCDYQQAQLTARHLSIAPHVAKWMSSREYSAVHLGTLAAILSKRINVNEEQIELR